MQIVPLADPPISSSGRGARSLPPPPPQKQAIYLLDNTINGAEIARPKAKAAANDGIITIISRAQCKPAADEPPSGLINLPLAKRGAAS